MFTEKVKAVEAGNMVGEKVFIVILILFVPVTVQVTEVTEVTALHDGELPNVRSLGKVNSIESPAFITCVDIAVN